MLKFYSFFKKYTFYILYFLLIFITNPILKKKIIEKYFFYKALANKKKMDKIFMKKKLLFNKNQKFYQLNPMTSKKFLDEYYNNFYWQSRDNINDLLGERDFRHFNIINKKKFNRSPSQKIILNYGSGHGGISILFGAKNFKVFNLDYQKNNFNLFYENYYFIKKFDEIPKKIKFDLIYSSHALEHVINPLQIIRKFKEYSNDTTTYFFEVPNGFDQKEIIPPHTYYYTKDFFKKIFKPVNSKSFFECNILLNNKYINANNFKGGVINLHTNYKVTL